MTHKQLNKQKQQEIEAYLKKYMQLTDAKYNELLFENAYNWLRNFGAPINISKEVKESWVQMFTRGGSAFWTWWKGYYRQIDEVVYRTLMANPELKSLSRQEFLWKYNTIHSMVDKVYPPTEVFRSCYNESEKVA